MARIVVASDEICLQTVSMAMNSDACVHYWEAEDWSVRIYSVLKIVTKPGGRVDWNWDTRRHGRGIKYWQALTWGTVRVKKYALSLMSW